MKNTGQNGGTQGVDINVETAWQITSGCPDITIAVLDEGVDLTHEDLADGILYGYTIGNPLGYGAPCSFPNLAKAHGTACAGIIGASDNSIGIKGVASGVSILPVNISPYGTSYFAPFLCKQHNGPQR